MVHEVYVPFAASVVRRALAEPARVARCLPGFQPGGEDPFTGARLRLRIAGSTITYRGDLAVSAGDDGVDVTGEGEEVRGTGTVRLSLTATARPADDRTGTLLSFRGRAEGTGRLAAVAAPQREAAGRRLLDRFAAALAEDLAAGGAPGQADPAAAHPGEAEAGRTDAGDREAGDREAGDREAGDREAGGADVGEAPGQEPEAPRPPAAGGIGEPEDNEPAIPGIPAPENGPDRLAEPEPEPGAGSVEEDLTRLGEGALPEEFDDDLVADLARAGTPVEPEADVARRTMIGRSAEEVDHAPPRGRYAPTPTPGAAPSPTAALRWAAPVAAAAVVGAVVVGRRLLRRRR